MSSKKNHCQATKAELLKFNRCAVVLVLAAATFCGSVINANAKGFPSRLDHLREQVSQSPERVLQDHIDELWKKFPSKTGLAIRPVADDWIVGKRMNEYFPQQSVSKLWVAMATFDAIDLGKLKYDQRWRLTAKDLTLFNQPISGVVLKNKFADFQTSSLLKHSITLSDNMANDRLLRAVGGPDRIRSWIKRKNLGEIKFGPGEKLLQSEIAGLRWDDRFSKGNGFKVARSKLPIAVRERAMARYLANPIDGATPKAIVNALAALYHGELLSEVSSRRMRNLLEQTKSGPLRLKAGAPGWVVAHKTGTGQVLGKVATGINDVGVITAPDGCQYAIAVMISSTSDELYKSLDFMQKASKIVVKFHNTSVHSS